MVENLDYFGNFLPIRSCRIFKADEIVSFSKDIEPNRTFSVTFFNFPPTVIHAPLSTTHLLYANYTHYSCGAVNNLIKEFAIKFRLK